MSGAKVKNYGSFNKTEHFISALIKEEYLDCLDKYGKEGVDVLRNATPRDSGETAESWEYEIRKDENGTVISWYNTNTVDGVNIAVILQYGHATRTGSYVKGIDYINPAMKPIFKKIAKEAWMEVQKS